MNSPCLNCILSSRYQITYFIYFFLMTDQNESLVEATKRQQVLEVFLQKVRQFRQKLLILNNDMSSLMEKLS